MKFITFSAKETQAAAKKIADIFKKHQAKGAAVLALEGELGSGKTTFVQGLAKALGVKEKVLSPTFVLMKRFGVRPLEPVLNKAKERDKNSPAKAEPPLKDLYHIDCYRIESPEELRGFGFGDILKNPGNLMVIEWAEKIKSILPPEAVWIKFEHKGGDKRIIQIFN